MFSLLPLLDPDQSGAFRVEDAAEREMKTEMVKWAEEQEQSGKE